MAKKTESFDDFEKAILHEMRDISLQLFNIVDTRYVRQKEKIEHHMNKIWTLIRDDKTDFIERFKAHKYKGLPKRGAGPYD